LQKNREQSEDWLEQPSFEKSPKPESESGSGVDTTQDSIILQQEEFPSKFGLNLLGSPMSYPSSADCSVDNANEAENETEEDADLDIPLSSLGLDFV